MMTIVIESGAIYSAFLIVLIATYESRSWSHYLILDAVRIVFLCSSEDELKGYRILVTSSHCECIYTIIREVIFLTLVSRDLCLR